MDDVVLDVSSRDRFRALDVPLVYFDGPGGTQCPDAVVEAVSSYMFVSNANGGGKFLTSMVTDGFVKTARSPAADFLGATPDETNIEDEVDRLLAALRRQ